MQAALFAFGRDRGKVEKHVSKGGGILRATNLRPAVDHSTVHPPFARSERVPRSFRVRKGEKRCLLFSYMARFAQWRWSTLVRREGGVHALNRDEPDSAAGGEERRPGLFLGWKPRCAIGRRIPESISANPDYLLFQCTLWSLVFGPTQKISQRTPHNTMPSCSASGYPKVRMWTEGRCYRPFSPVDGERKVRGNRFTRGI